MMSGNDHVPMTAYEEIQKEFYFDKDKLDQYESAMIDNINLEKIVDSILSIVYIRDEDRNLKHGNKVTFNDFEISKEDLSNTSVRYRLRIFGELVMEEVYETSLRMPKMSPQYRFTLPYILYWQNYIIDAVDRHQKDREESFKKRFYDMVDTLPQKGIA